VSNNPVSPASPNAKLDSTERGTAAPTSPPAAPIKEFVDVLHGVTVRDPYRYLEDVKSANVRAWLLEQSQYARDTLDQIAVRAQLLRRITDLTDAAGDVISDVVRLPGHRLYYLKRPKGERQFKLVTRVGFTGKEITLVDPEIASSAMGVPHAINFFVPSWDGRYVAYGMSSGGSENASLYIHEIASGKTVGESIPRVHQGHVFWLPDSQSLTFNQFRDLAPGTPDSETCLDSTVMWLKLGEAGAQAVFGPTVTITLGLTRLDVASIRFAPGSPWMIARTTDTTLPEGFLFVAPLADLGKPEVAWSKISDYGDKITGIELKGNDLYLKTYAEAPRRRVMRLDLRQPDLTKAVEVAVAPAGGVLEDFMVTASDVICLVRQGTNIVLRRYAPGDKVGKAIAMPSKGAASVHADPAHAYTDVLYTLSSWTDLPRVFTLSGETSMDTGLLVNPPIPGLPEIEILDVEVPSHDGVRVPMTILFRRDLKRDGSNPTLLYGYGAYGFSIDAGFSPARMAWLEQGGVYAAANVRGSGVHGDDWYRAGFKTTKTNTWLDGIACAQYLIGEQFASPQTMGILGGSAGGIFAGRAVTGAPELFAAGIFAVGSMDTVRAEESANGITNISEFGSAKKPEEFPALLNMSTYHQIKDGVAYPAILLVHGINDPRVDVWHSAKTAARLQAATSSGKPVLLRLDMEAGHGIGSTTTQRNAESADIYSFLLWQMGKTERVNGRDV
jgi:prolyl oligopeptidase